MHAVAWQIHRDADHLDEEELRDEAHHVRLDAVDAPPRLAETAHLELLIDRQLLDVVPQHQLVCLAHRELGLVLVRARRQRQQLADPIERLHPLAARRRRRDRLARGTPVDPALFAHAAKRLAVRGLVRHAQHFVDVLVRHLVLEHAHHLGPWPLEHHRSRELERAATFHPLTQLLAMATEHDHGRDERVAEVRPVLARVAPPQLAHERRFQLRRQLGLHRPTVCPIRLTSLLRLYSSLELQAAIGARTRDQRQRTAAGRALRRVEIDRRGTFATKHLAPVTTQQLGDSRQLVLLDQEVRPRASTFAGAGRTTDERRDIGLEAALAERLHVGDRSRHRGHER